MKFLAKHIISLLSLMLFVACVPKNMAHEKSQKQNTPLYCSHCLCEPSKALLDLLSLLQITHDKSLPSIVAGTQASWIRPKNQERWHIVKKHQPFKHKILSLLESMGLLKAHYAQDNHYRYAVLLGSTYSRVKKRVLFLIEEVQRGIIFDEIVLLGSDRLLDKNIEKIDVSNPAYYPRTESDMLELVFRQLIPESMKQIPVKLVNTPMKLEHDKTYVRPNTSDSVAQWLQLKPSPGKTLVISSQPYVSYQDAVMQTILPSSFQFETVGDASDDEDIAVHLDNLARILYQRQQLIIRKCEH